MSFEQREDALPLISNAYLFSRKNKLLTLLPDRLNDAMGVIGYVRA